MNKVWTYAIGRQLNDTELNELQLLGNEFVSSWTAHENKLEASFEIFKRTVIIIRVNESVYGASGCSIDKQLRFIKEMEKKFNVQLLNRMLVPVELAGSIAVISSGKVKDMLAEGKLTAETPVLNTAVSSEDELRVWKQPLKQTWLNKYL